MVGDWVIKVEETKAQVLMEMRGYQEIRRSELEGVVEFLVNPKAYTKNGRRLKVV